MPPGWQGTWPDGSHRLVTGEESPRVAIVTGAASGIGASVAAELTDRGWRVTGFDLQPSEWHLSRRVDVSDAVARGSRGGRVERELHPVGAVVSAAGHYAMVDAGDITPEQWRTMLRVHLGGLLNLCRAVLPGMLRAGGGRIVLVSSE